MNRNTRRNEMPRYVYGLLLLGLLLILIGAIFMIRRYTPTKEHMSLDEYFGLSREDEAAVILNGKYQESTAEDFYAVVSDGSVYLNVDFVKNDLDDGYVYDRTENILRYVTEKDVISASLDNNKYTVGKSGEDLGKSVVITREGDIFLSLDFVMQYTDVSYYYVEDPNRVVIETAGYEKKVSTLKKDTPLRRFGGVKSKILKDASKGDRVSILEDYGKWSYVLTDDGVLACVQNRRLKKSESEMTEARIPERKYEHISLPGDIILGWHQVTSDSANRAVEETLVTTDVNVVSPTWFYLDDNRGGIANLASSSYVDYCHQNNIQVWALVSNLENKNVDTTTVLNTTSSRDNLVNNLIAAAISYDLDGINVDMEALSVQAKDGYIEFIKELSLKCEKNDIILSVDNYVPTSSTEFYNRKVQADYADYIIIMAYDEHTTGSEEAGSVSSLGFVKDGIKNTLKEVPAEQVIVGLPFYSRIWAVDGDNLSCSAYGMKDLDTMLDSNGAGRVWLDDLGQNYAEYVKNDVTYKCWIEDSASIAKKLEVMQENKLAGAAFWKLRFEPNEIWTTIDNYLKK